MNQRLLPLLMVCMLASSASAVRYCKPTALKDFNFIVHQTAVVSTAHCTAPALVRRRSPSVTDAPVRLPPRTLSRISLFISWLEYSEDGRKWLPLVVK